MNLNDAGQRVRADQVQAELRVQFPSDYATFMEEHNGAEGWVGEQYLVLYPLEQLVMLNDIGRIQENLPGFVLFGSDGGGMDYFFDARNTPVKIVTGPDIGTTVTSLRSCGDSFEAFLAYLFESTDQ